MVKKNDNFNKYCKQNEIIIKLVIMSLFMYMSFQYIITFINYSCYCLVNVNSCFTNLNVKYFVLVMMFKHILNLYLGWAVVDLTIISPSLINPTLLHLTSHLGCTNLPYHINDFSATIGLYFV